MRIQLWSYNYDPEPTGIGPVSTQWARAMRDRGHTVDVVAAHPHYPEPKWGRRHAPYRELRDGISVTRLPIWFGRATRFERLRQEASYMMLLTAALPWLGQPDVLVAVSPSFPALVPTLLNTRVRGVPWALWVQDILPDGALSSRVLEEGRMVTAARRLEQAAYSSADRIVVLSPSAEENLASKGVPRRKIHQIYNPTTGLVREGPRIAGTVDPRLVLTMGNIGFSQGLVAIVEAFEEHEGLRQLGARFVLTGDGVAAEKVRDVIRTERVLMTGLLDTRDLQCYLDRAAVAIVSQCYDGAEFNVPSKLMNFMANGIPVVASVGETSEVARILTESEGGWVTNSREPLASAHQLAQVLSDPEELARRGKAGLEYAAEFFTPAEVAQRFETALTGLGPVRLSL